MWKINEDGTVAKNKRNGYTMYACAAVIINDQYEARIDEMFDTIDEAKDALAKIVAEDNAEEAKKLWQIDDDGNAHCPRGKIFRTKLSVDKLPFPYVIVKYIDVIGIEGMETLAFAETDDEARQVIKEFVDKFNEEDEDDEDDAEAIT